MKTTRQLIPSIALLRKPHSGASDAKKGHRLAEVRRTLAIKRAKVVRANLGKPKFKKLLDLVALWNVIAIAIGPDIDLATADIGLVRSA